MDYKEYIQPSFLEKYAFIWSEARLLVAALALFSGGVPPVLHFLPVSALYPLVGGLLTIALVISGVVSAYLLYRWWTGGQMLFGGKENLDTAAFFVNIISGLNLGITGIFGTNIGMSITSNYILFVVTGLVYLASAYHLYQRWDSFGKKIF